ncbi:MAG TPA: hypothetical protein DDW52_26980 [Planctomycetaceae bacterium]|nr:hypothetical protein [Planctomycetaceae bacterium]
MRPLGYAYRQYTLSTRGYLMRKRNLLPVAKAIHEVAGFTPDRSTIWRWHAKGSGGIKLKTWMVGGRRMSNITSVIEFIERRTAQACREVQS